MDVLNKLVSRSVHAVDCNTTFLAAARLMRDKKVGSLLVTENGKITGIISETDIARQVVAKGLAPDAGTVGTIMSSPIYTIDVGSTPEMANNLMKEKGIRHLAVTEEGEIIGVISVRDLLQYFKSYLMQANKELEAFSYSVSHDLRAPLRAIDGFSQALLEDYEDKLDEEGKDYLHRVRAGCQRMGHLIDDILSLSRVTRSEMQRAKVDMTALAHTIASELHNMHPDRQAEFAIEKGVIGEGDPRMLRVLLENLLNNAWKFTQKEPFTRIEFGVSKNDGREVYCVHDNGVGFDMTYADKMFTAFQRLHKADEFDGTGVGLATAQRIIYRHGGRIWAEGVVGQGATFFFTL